MVEFIALSLLLIIVLGIYLLARKMTSDAHSRYNTPAEYLTELEKLHRLLQEREPDYSGVVAAMSNYLGSRLQRLESKLDGVRLERVKEIILQMDSTARGSKVDKEGFYSAYRRLAAAKRLLEGIS